MRRVSGILAAALALSVASSSAGAQQVVNTDIARVVLGFMIECYGCDATGSGTSASYEYRSPPIVISVARGGPGESAGLKPGDVLTHINGVSITTSEGARLLSGAQDGKPLKLTVRRAGTTTELTLTPKRETSATSATSLGQKQLVDLVYQPRRWTFGYSFDSLNSRWSDSAYLDRARYLTGWDSLAAGTYFQKSKWPADSSKTLWTLRADTINFWRLKSDSLASPAWDYRIGRKATELTAEHFTSTFAGLELTIDGTTPVKVTVVEPDCALALDVNGTRILLRSTRCKE